MRKSVSFIIPIYNAEAFLPACLDSVLDQTTDDLEVICINDGSQDSSQQILESYARKDSRIKLIQFDQNKGPGTARNVGIAAASGKYIRMLDGDDFIPLDSTEKMLQAAEQYGSNFVRGGYMAASKQGKISVKGEGHPEELVINTSIRNDQRLWASSQHWTYLINREILLESAVKYDVSMRNGQDAAFMIDLMPHMEKVTLIPDTVYYYRNNPESATRKSRDENYFINVFSLYDRAYKKLAPINLKEAADFMFYSALCGYFPLNIFPSIPDNLSYENSKTILLYLKDLLEKYDIQKLCTSNPAHYSWQDHNAPKTPIEVKYLILLLQEIKLTEAYHSLDSFKKRIRKEQKLRKQLERSKRKLSVIRNSTSWKITSPLRRATTIVKNKLNKQ